MTCSMAFFWAVEPSPFRVPVAAAPADELDDPAPALPLAAGVPVLLEPQAARARAPTRATPATRLDRESFTACVPLSREVSGAHCVRPPPGAVQRLRRR